MADAQHIFLGFTQTVQDSKPLAGTEKNCGQGKGRRTESVGRGNWAFAAAGRC